MIDIIIGNFVLGVGELCILPTMLAAISEFSPLNLRSTMMGILFLSLAFSGYLAGLIAKIASIENVISQNSALNYSHAFFQIAIIALVIGLGVICLNTYIKQFLN